MHFLLFSGIGELLCHHPYCFPSQSQTLFGIDAGRPPITAVARWLFRRENTFDFAGGRGRRVNVIVWSTFRNTHIFRDWQRSLLGYYNHFCVFSFIRIFFFFNLLNFYPFIRFLVSPLLVTRYCVTLFRNTHWNPPRGRISWRWNPFSDFAFDCKIRNPDFKI